MSEPTKTVILAEYVFPTEKEDVFAHGYHSGEALQYYGGDTGILIHWTPTYHRTLYCEKVKVDTKTNQNFNPYQRNPHYKG